MQPTIKTEPDLGDVVIVLLAGTLAGLRDRLEQDDFPKAADLVADLTGRCDDYIEASSCDEVAS